MSGIQGSNGKTSALKIRLGYFDDLTTAPIVAGIEGSVKSAILRRGTPTEIRDLFNSSEIEAALLPAPEALRAPNCVIIPASVSAAVGPSRLFMIFSKKVPTEIKRVLVDNNDLGSEQLARVIFAKKLMIRPEFVRIPKSLDPAEYDLTQNDGFDAYLIAGRNCFFVRKEAFSFTLDLTSAWYELTKLPYVIHAWALRKGYRLGNTLEKEIGDVARRNENSRELVARTAEKSKMMESGVRAVYEKALLTRFDPQVIGALRQFAKELVQMRILNVPPVSIYTPPLAMKKAGTA